MVSSIDVKALNIFVSQPVSQNMIHRLVVATLQVLPCSDDKEPRNGTHEGRSLPSLMTFINRLVRYTNVYTGTLMTTLVYLDRLKHKLPQNAQGLPCTRHRIFLSCLILASKFHNDCSPKNVHWAKYTDGLFSLKDVNLMERQLLYLLNWDMRVSNDEMCTHLASFLEPIREGLVKSSKMKMYLAKQQAAVASASSGSISSRSSSKSSSTSPSPSPPMSRSSSTTSHLSLHHHQHTRQSSSVSIASANSVMSHCRQDSYSSLESLSPRVHMNTTFSDKMAAVDPRIEMAARNEEQELSRMISQIYRPSA